MNLGHLVYSLQLTEEQGIEPFPDNTGGSHLFGTTIEKNRSKIYILQWNICEINKVILEGDVQNLKLT